ncbi:SAGA-associated factor 29-like isoform X3 [Artemia franciscana]|uniref:SAGA-associated factor 29-like isoform X3 n=1 Tax=Artemia franciscana TaxID=6661 RepID=UPI0032DA0AC3
MDLASSQIQDRLKVLTKLIHQLPEVHAKAEDSYSAVEQLREKATDDRKQAVIKGKLKSVTLQASNEAEKEQELLRKALSKIYEIRQIRNEKRIQARQQGNKETMRRITLMKMLHQSAQTIPLWLGKEGETPPPLCGSVSADSNYIAKAGDMVAALVKGPEADENWILAEVVSFSQSQGRYEVFDIDEEQKEKHILSKRRIVVLPLMRASPEINPEALFSKVMALYPQTTCFYKAIISELPSSSQDDYHVSFEDPNYAGGFSPPLMVPQRYVFALKEKKK